MGKQSSVDKRVDSNFTPGEEAVTKVRAMSAVLAGIRKRVAAGGQYPCELSEGGEIAVPPITEAIQALIRK